MTVDLVANLLGEWISGRAKRSQSSSVLDGHIVAAFTRSRADVDLAPMEEPTGHPA
jgi:hypothetical protein